MMGSRADPYSTRSATRGSVLDARKAGRYEATSATAVSAVASLSDGAHASAVRLDRRPGLIRPVRRRPR